jgi:hypothetical protein
MTLLARAQVERYAMVERSTGSASIVGAATPPGKLGA